MKHIFLAAFIVMTIMSAIAWRWRPVSTPDGRAELIWVCDDNPIRRAQIEQFNRLHPKYFLKLDPQNGTVEKIVVQSLAGVGPDLFDCYDNSQLAAYVRSGIAMDLTDDLPRYGIDLNAVWPCLKPIIYYGGRAFAHPGNANAPAIWYNKDIFDAAGVPYPQNGWTWEEFIEIAKRLTKYDERGRPVQSPLLINDTEWYRIFPTQWGAHKYTAEGTRSAWDSPESLAGAQFFQDLMHKHRVIPSLGEVQSMSSAGGWGQGIMNLFGAGKAAMAVGGRWWLCVLRGEEYKHLRLGAVELPSGPTNRITGGGRSTCINAHTRNKEGALAFLAFMHGPEWNNMVNTTADALAPVMKYSYTDEFLHNPEHPEEDYNEVWRAALEHADPDENSPFVNGQTILRAQKSQSDMLYERMKSGADAMREVARAMNGGIVETLRVDPVLKQQYDELLAGGAKPAWDRPEDAP
jgi:multiple sugar transport system substrate-binding protein